MAFFNSPIFGIALTVIVFVASMKIYQHVKWLHPILLTAITIISILTLSGIPYESYKLGGDIISFFLGPATVALAVPLYKYYRVIREEIIPIILGIVVGSLAGIFIVGGLVLVTGGSYDLAYSVIPKIVTAPIAIEIADRLGGVPQLAAVLTALTGLIGSMLGPEVLKACGIRDEVAIGCAVGTAAHGIGTARLLHESELQGSVSGFSMGLTAIIVSILVIPLY
jgi:predicted murein hydrolase (TIGR00659 family)